MYDNRTQVLAEAQVQAITRSTYPADTGPVDPEAATREAIAGLGTIAPSVGVAAALLNVASVRPVPMDRDSLEPTGGPLGDLGAVEAHWRTSYTDAVGVRAGVQANGSTIFAVRGTLAALRGWMAEVGTEATEKVNEYGTTLHTSRSYRQVPPFVQIGWSAPPPARARSITSFGAGLLDVEKQLHSNRRDDARALEATAWLAWTVATVWTVAPQAGELGEGQRQLVVRSQRLGSGVDVVGDGDLIPWHVRRGNGWTCSGLNMPIASDQPMPPWLTDAVGAKWKAVR